jgi:heptosyltransferase II
MVRTCLASECGRFPLWQSPGPVTIRPHFPVPPSVSPLVTHMRLGVFLPNWVGDVVMATPALRALRKLAGPTGALVGVMRPYVADVLAGSDWFDEAILYAKQSNLPDQSSRAATRKVRAAGLDCVVVLTNSFRTAWMAWQSGVGERIGYSGQMRSLLLTKRVSNPNRAGKVWSVPTIDSFLQLAEAAGCPPEPPRLELATTPADERAADAVWQRLRLRAGESVVVLNSGGAFGGAKHWPAEYFAALACRIVSDHDLPVLVNCGPSERAIAKEIVDRAADSRVVSLAEIEELPIGLTKACIRRSRLLVTTDSGPRFMGVAFGKPVVTLFGPTDPRMTGTHYERETCLSLSLDCQPCMARECPLRHHRCMRDLTVEWVYEAAVRYVSESCEPVASATGGAVARKTVVA